MIRYLALAVLPALIAATPAPAAAVTHVGSSTTGPSVWHSISSPPTTGTGTQHEIYPIQRTEFPILRTPPDLHLNGCAFCTGHDGGVGTQPN